MSESELAALIPATRAELTAEWLGFVIGRRHAAPTATGDLQFEVTLGAEPGTNYATTVYAVHVTRTQLDGEPSAERREEHRLIIKLPHDDPFGRFFCYATRCYEREILFYAELAPALEAALGRQLAVPRYYHGATDGKGGVVMAMDDLREAGYRMPAAAELLSLHQVRLVVAALAEVVAAGLLVQQGSDGAEVIDAPLLNIDSMWRGPRMDADLIKCGLQGYIGFLKHYPQQAASVEKLESLLECARDIMVEGMQGGGRLRSVCHGDLWKLNMMFRQPSDAAEPAAVMLLDWQHCHVGNFLVDLFSVLVNNTDRQFRRRHTDDVLTYFHDRLAETLTAAGLQPQRLGLSREQLLQDYKASMKPALMRVIFDVVLPLADADATAGAAEDASPQQLVDRLVTAMCAKTEDRRLERHLLDIIEEMTEAGVI